MLNFPNSAEFNKIMPKEAFYKNLSLSAEMKDKFVSDIKRIVWQYKLSPSTLNVEKGEIVDEILVLNVELKKQDFDRKILELISKQNSHKVLYILSFENTTAFAVFVGKIYSSEWKQQDDLTPQIKGLNLDKVWEHFVRQIAIDEQTVINKSEQVSVETLLKEQEEKQKLQSEITALENKIKNTKQFNLQVKLKQDLKKLKERL
jgi:hypothetical protein